MSYKNNTILNNIKKLWYRLQKKGTRIIFIWAKAHTGLYGNELADQLAKEAVHNGDIVHIQPCISEGSRIIKNSIIDKRKRNWETFISNSQTNYALIQPTLLPKPWYDEMNVSRKYITTINRLRFGHACFPAHLFKIKINNSDLCDVCYVRSDLNHLFFECLKYTQQRENLFQNLFQVKNIQSPFNILNLLAKSNTRNNNIIMTFLHESNLQL